MAGHSVLRDVARSWPLFFGMFLLMVGNGLLMTLLTVRAADLGFSRGAIGIMQSCYPAGALLGCMVAPRIVVAVGHVRAFGALASLCSTAALIHLVTADPYSWGAMRALAGFCFPGLYVVAESWLNGQARNETRAALLSVYFITQTGGAVIGQLALSIPNADATLLFVIVSVLISLSLVPMLLSTRGEQGFEAPSRISFAELYRISPFGVIGCFLSGVSQGALLVCVGLYGVAVGLPSQAIGFLVAFVGLGGILAQYPAGAASDRIDRRLVIAGLSLGGLAVALGLVALGSSLGAGAGLYGAVTLIGALLLPVYSLCIAHANDHLRPDQMVAASSALVLVMNAGVIFGPVLGASFIDGFGPSGLFALLAALQGGTALLAAYRYLYGRPGPLERGRAAPIAHAATPAATRLHPEAMETNMDAPIRY